MVFEAKLYKELRLQENLEYVTQKVLSGGKLESIEEALEFPRFINLKTTNNCTARCVMCGIEEWRKNIQSPYMHDALFFKIADEILQNQQNVQKVALFAGNEPMLDKNLAQRISYLSKPNSAGGGGNYSPYSQWLRSA